MVKGSLMGKEPELVCEMGGSGLGIVHLRYSPHPCTVRAPVPNLLIGGDLCSTLEILQEIVLTQVWGYSPVPD